jgi:hypothetical protein
MLNNNEKELLLKLLMEKATGTDRVNLQLVTKAEKPVKKQRRRVYGCKKWTTEELNYLKMAITLGQTNQEIARHLGNRTIKAIETARYTLAKQAS